MTPLSRPELAECVATATLAPSLHNSQPWQFAIRGEDVEIYADHRRQLDVLDPDGRELLVSVGAVVFTLRLAIRGAGRIPELDLLPDPDRPDLVARVRPGRGAPVPESVRELLGAVARRHTNRKPFRPGAVPAEVIEELSAAARHEDATFTIAGPVARTAIIGLGRVAEQRLRARGEYRAELRRWTRPDPARRDGIPPVAVGPWDALERMPVRDFGLLNPQPGRRAERFEAYPTIGVLSTGGDHPAAWLCAGQALQRVLLVATRRGLATTPISQPVEIPAVRSLLSDRASNRWAQMVVRLGYGERAPTTPRRPLAEVLPDRVCRGALTDPHLVD
jgi:nitroreductase